MTAAQLTLECFSQRLPNHAAMAQRYDAADIEAAHAAGEASGRAAAEAAALATLAAAVERLSVALQADETHRQLVIADASRALGDLVSAVVAVLAPACRTDSLVRSIIATLAEHLATAGVSPAVIRCEPAAQPALRAALDAAGLGAITITTIPFGAELSSAGGLLRIDPDRLRAQLEKTIAEIKESAA